MAIDHSVNCSCPGESEREGMGGGERLVGSWGVKIHTTQYAKSVFVFVCPHLFKAKK